MTEPAASGHSNGVEVCAHAAALPAEVPHGTGAASFEALYDAHVDRIWRALARLGVEPMHVEDAAQEVFVTAWKRLPELRERSSVAPWLIGIAVKVASHHRRTTRRRGAREALDGGPSQSPAPDEVLSRGQGLALLHRVLSNLSETQREVFVMMEMEGLSAPEASAVLGVGANTIYSRLRLARAAFDQAVERVQESWS